MKHITRCVLYYTCNDIFDINDQISENKYSHIRNVSIIYNIPIFPAKYYPFLSPLAMQQRDYKKRKQKREIATNYVKLFAKIRKYFST